YSPDPQLSFLLVGVPGPLQPCHQPSPAGEAKVEVGVIPQAPPLGLHGAMQVALVPASVVVVGHGAYVEVATVSIQAVALPGVAVVRVVPGGVPGLSVSVVVHVGSFLLDLHH